MFRIHTLLNHHHFLNSSAIFLTKLVSSPRHLIFSSKALSLSWVSSIICNLFSKALYLTIKSLISSSFYESCFCMFYTSFSLLFNLSSKYYLMLISWVPKNCFSLTFSSSIAAFDYNLKLSIYPFDSPNSWARELLINAIWSLFFFNLILFFSRTSILSSSYFIYWIYFSLLTTKFLRRSYLVFAYFSYCSLIFLISKIAWLSYYLRSFLYALFTLSSSSCITFTFYIIKTNSAIYLSFELAK